MVRLRLSWAGASGWIGLTLQDQRYSASSSSSHEIRPKDQLAAPKLEQGQAKPRMNLSSSLASAYTEASTPIWARRAPSLFAKAKKSHCLPYSLIGNQRKEECSTENRSKPNRSKWKSLKFFLFIIDLCCSSVAVNILRKGNIRIRILVEEVPPCLLLCYQSWIDFIFSQCPCSYYYLCSYSTSHRW